MSVVKNKPVTIASSLARLQTRALDSFYAGFLIVLYVLSWNVRDGFYTIANLIMPYRQPGAIVPPLSDKNAYQAPVPGRDSRSPCPAINALANHNLLPRNGKRITYHQLSKSVQLAYNLSSSISDQLVTPMLLIDNGRGYLDLEDLSTMNLIQHDASFTRPDIALCPDQSYPHADLVEKFLANSTNGESFSIADLSAYSSLRRRECRQSNGQYSLTYSFLHKFFASGNCGLMYACFGGNIKDLRIWLKEERLPDGWEPRNRERYGLTIGQAIMVTLAIESNVDEHNAFASDARDFLQNDLEALKNL